MAILDLVASGGQTGVDQGALRAARACGIETGGWAAKGWLVEGPNGKGWVGAPWLADYGLAECADDGFPARTEANVRDADVTIWFGPGDSLGYRCTEKATLLHDRPLWRVATTPTDIMTPGDLAALLRRDDVRRVNCAGSRESKQPGIRQRTEAFLVRTFRILMEVQQHADRRTV